MFETVPYKLIRIGKELQLHSEEHGDASEIYLDFKALYNDYTLAQVLGACPKSEVYVIIGKQSRFCVKVMPVAKSYTEQAGSKAGYVAKLNIAEEISFSVPLRLFGIETFDSTTDWFDVSFDRGELVSYALGEFKKSALTLYIQVNGRSVDRAMGYGVPRKSSG